VTTDIYALYASILLYCHKDLIEHVYMHTNMAITRIDQLIEITCRLGLHANQ